MEESYELINNFPKYTFLIVIAVTKGLAFLVKEKGIRVWKPDWLQTKLFKSLFPTVTLGIGIGVAFGAKGVNQFNYENGYIVLLGIFAGLIAIFLWDTFGAFLKKMFKLEKNKHYKPNPS